MSSFANQIKIVRKNMKLTQKQLASMLGITERAYQYYESGEREPSAESLKLIASTLNTTTDYLLGRGIYAQQEKILAKRKELTEALSKFLTPEMMEGVKVASDEYFMKIVDAVFARIDIDLDKNIIECYPVIPPRE